MWHGNECTPACRDLAVPSPYDRERPPGVACPHCGAAPWVACHIVGPGKVRRLERFGRFHPSRLELAS